METVLMKKDNLDIYSRQRHNYLMQSYLKHRLSRLIINVQQSFYFTGDYQENSIQGFLSKNIINMFLSFRALKFMDDMLPFRDGYSYNHYNFMLLGHIAEIITGRSWEWLIKNKILKPAGMERARIWKSADDVFRRDTVHPLWVIFESNMFMQPTSTEYNK